MSKYINRQKRKARTIDQVLDLIKHNNTDAVFDEYVFRFGKDYLIRENEQIYQDCFGLKYSTSSYDLVKKKLLK